MSSNKNKSWNTRYGPRRVRNEAPDVGEAIAAARGLSDDIDEQADIAAGLIGLPRETVMAELTKTLQSRQATTTVAFSGRHGMPRTVVVQRKPVRRLPSRTALPRKLDPAG